MEKLYETPHNSGYAVSTGEDSISAKFSGGLSRKRRTMENAPLRVAVSWNCTYDLYNYLKAFYEKINKGVDKFKIDLVIDYLEREEYTCQLEGTNFDTASFVGNSCVVSWTLEVLPNDRDLDYDASVLEVFEMYGRHGGYIANLLDYLVNQHIPSRLDNFND
jgi:hypothetical protein